MTESTLAPALFETSLRNRLFYFAGLFFLILLCPVVMAQNPPALINLDGQRFLIKDDQGSIAKLSFVGFGKGYRWLNRPKPSQKQQGDQVSYLYRRANSPLDWQLDIAQQGDNILIDAHVLANRDLEIEYIGLQIEVLDLKRVSHFQITDQNNKRQNKPLPLDKSALDGAVKIAAIDQNQHPLFSLDFAQPASLHADRSVRIKLKEQRIAAQEKASNQFVLSFSKPGIFYSDITQHPTTSQHQNWFSFNPKNTTSHNELSMSDWLESPKQPVTRNGGALMMNGKPFKVWGTNVEYAAVAPSRPDATQRAEFFAKHGINGVRLHKLTNPGWEGLGSKQSASTYDPQKLEKFDFFIAELKRNHITYSLSPIWDLKVFPGDKKKLLNYDEVAKVGHTRGLVWFAKDVQDLHIETMVNLLNHKNSHTGLSYAEDPANVYFEIQNEADIFFYTTSRFVQRLPTYKKLFAKQFSGWLRQRYGSHEQLKKAWGAGALNKFKSQGAYANEHLDKDNIYPVGNPWMWDNQIQHRTLGKRLQDTARFLLESQNNYYQRAVQAIRDTGFQGEIVTSNWQAGSGPAHLLNLYSDAKFGMVDRHNYMGGAAGATQHLLMPGYNLKNDTMLPKAGSRLLSSGMQQVKDVPFVFSEWLAVPPVEWAAADTTIIAAYGMGLQDWDLSYHFVSNGNGFTGTLNYPKEKKFNNLTPVGVGLFPVLSRMVLRGDITPGEVIATRRTTVEQAATGTYDFTSTSIQTHDLKSFDGSPGQQALAVGQILIEFTDNTSPSTLTDWQKYRKGNTIHASNKQLKWTEGNNDTSGFIEINSKGTQGYAGFTGNNTFAFNDMTITAQSKYSVVLATAQAQDKTLANDDNVILMAIARAHNSGMSFDQDLIVSVGQAPTLLEPVKAELQFKRTPKRITVLDHDGNKTQVSHSLVDGKFIMDTGRDKSPYYLIEY